MLFQKIFLSLLESRLKDKKRILPTTLSFKKRNPGVLRVATVQINYIRLSGIVEFSLFINQYLQKMSNFSPDLIVFPSLMDYLLLGTFPINLFSKDKRKLLKDMKFCLRLLNRSIVEYMKMISQMWKCGVVFGTSQGIAGFLNGSETERVFETNNVKVLIASKQSVRNSFYLRKHTDAEVKIVAIGEKDTYSVGAVTISKEGDVYIIHKIKGQDFHESRHASGELHWKMRKQKIFQKISATI